MESISHHITPLVLNSLTADTHTQTRIPMFLDKVILRNQECAGLQPTHNWLKTEPILPSLVGQVDFEILKILYMLAKLFGF